MPAITLRICGNVSSSTCRYTRHGVPVVELELQDTGTGQTVCVQHHYPDKGTTSCTAARHLAARLRGQSIDITAVRPRFKANRLVCEADLIPASHPDRRDLD